MKAAIINFPGSYDAANTRRVFSDLLGLEAEDFPHDIENLQRLQQYEVVCVPGGSSYADIAAPGRLARSSKVAVALRSYSEGDGRMIGIGNGFQILCELGVLPGTLLRNRNCAFLNERLSFIAANRESIFTKDLPADASYRLPVSCYYGRYYADRRTIQEIEEKNQVAFHFATRFGEPDAENSRHGSLHGVAGVLNRKKNVLGVIFHPERATDAELGNADGLSLLKSFIA